MPYRSDLDGLRGLAVLLVMATHAGFPWANNGGDVGVTAFFVLSGFLITRLMMIERSGTGTVDLGAFYRRRFWRLGPPLAMLLVATVAIGLATDLPNEWALGVATCIAYISNWVQVLGHQIDPLGHTWSLAIEEQFYLGWPLVFLFLGRGRAAWIAAIGVGIGFVVRTLSTGDFEYFSTVTRGDAILLGCLLALTEVRVPRWLSALGCVSLVVLAYLNLNHDLSISLAMIAASVVIVGRWEPLGALAAIGRRSYALYLWDWPMTILFGPAGALLTFAIAELSYRAVERPIARRRQRQPRPHPDRAGAVA